MRNFTTKPNPGFLIENYTLLTYLHCHVTSIKKLYGMKLFILFLFSYSLILSYSLLQLINLLNKKLIIITIILYLQMLFDLLWGANLHKVKCVKFNTITVLYVLPSLFNYTQKHALRETFYSVTY